MSQRIPAPTAVALLVTLLSAPLTSSGHDGPHPATDLLSQQIEAAPADAGLYISRAYSYLESGHWAAAFADLDFAEALAGAVVEADLHRARAYHWWAMNSADEALATARRERSCTHLDRFLDAHPQHAEAAGLLERLEALRDDPCR